MSDVELRFRGDSRHAVAATRDVRGELDKLDRKVDDSSSRFGGFWTTMGKRAAIGLGAVGAAAGGLVAVTGFRFNQMREQAEIAFSTMLGSGEKARKFLGELQDFAAKTPFEFPELVSSSQRLLAMGFAAKDVLPTLTAVGDATAALGGSPEVMQRVTTALGQIQAKGKASAEEMLQLTESGIPAWQFLADKIGTSVPEAMERVSKGAIDSETTIAAVTEGINRRFGGMMEKQSSTFGGLLSTVKDTFTQLSGTVMAPFFDLATKGLQRVVDFTSSPTFTQGIESMGEKLRQVGNFIVAEVVPRFQAFVGWIRANVVPIAMELFQVWTNAWQRIMAAVQENEPELRRIFERVIAVIREIWKVARPIVKLLFEEVLPVAIDLAIEALDLLTRAIEPLAQILVRVLGGAIKFVIQMIDAFLGIISTVAGKFTWLPKVGDDFKRLQGAVDGARERLRKTNDELDKADRQVNARVNVRVTGVRQLDLVNEHLDQVRRATGDGEGLTVNVAPPLRARGDVSSALWDELYLAQQHGLTVSSAYRPGAITSTGNRSLHSLFPSKAVDLVGSESRMASFTRRLLSRGGYRELLHSTVPGAISSNPTIRAQHFDHVHVGTWHTGGLIPGDPHGEDRVATVRPGELILEHAQQSALARNLGGRTTIVVPIVNPVLLGSDFEAAKEIGRLAQREIGRIVALERG